MVRFRPGVFVLVGLLACKGDEPKESPSSCLPGCDGDGDGAIDAAQGGDDCDDADAGVFPGAAEICNGQDDDCDLQIDDDDTLNSGDAPEWHPDADSDGFGASVAGVIACEGPGGWLEDASDCADDDATRHPGVAEICNGRDDDCDAAVDDADPEVDLSGGSDWVEDLDGDGFGAGATVRACAAPTAHTAPGPADCAPNDASVHPNQPDPCDDGLDQNCDGSDVCLPVLGGDHLLGEAAGVLRGSAQAARLARGLSLVGDVDGDWVEDLAVSGQAEGDGISHTWLVPGTGLFGDHEVADVDAAELTGVAPFDYAVVPGPAGDVNGDGFGDLIVGAFLADDSDPESGAAYLVLGPVVGALSLADADAVMVGEDQTNYAGLGAIGVGDTDGDGLDDLLVGAILHDQGGVDGGAAYLVRGAPSGTLSLADADAELYGAAGANAGISLAGADLDGDGLSDLVIGGPGSGGVGAAWLMLAPIGGLTDLLSADATFNGESAGSAAGTVVSILDDHDGDGTPDLLVGAPTEDRAGFDAGAVYVVSGVRRGAVALASADAVLLGESPGQTAGQTAGGAGDLDGDGQGDLAVGAWQDSTYGVENGAVYLVRGPVAGTVPLGTADGKWAGDGSTNYQQAGITLGLGRDLNLDGFADVAVGMTGDAVNGLGSGAVFVLFGGSL